MDIAQLGIEVQSGGVKSATNDLAKFSNAARVAERAASGLSGSSNKFSSAEISAMAAAMGGLEKISNAASKAMAAASLAAQRVGSLGASGVRALGQSAGAARQQVQNLSYQMQDIITMLLSGQAPFMLLAQQLPQVTQNGGQLNGVFSAIKQTITGLISPLGLATTAFVLIGSAAVSYFSEWMSKGSESNKIAEEQARLIQTVADRWGDAIPALREYADQLKRAKDLADLKQGLGIINEDTLEGVRAKIAETVVSLADMTSQLNAAGEESTIIKEIENSFTAFSKAADQGAVTLSEVERVQNALAAAINSTGLPAVASFAAFFEKMGNSALIASQKVNEATKAAMIAQIASYPSQGAYSNVERSADGPIQNPGFATPEFGPRPESRPLIELDGLPKVKGAGGAKQKAYETATTSIAEQTRALQAQTAAQSTLNPLVSDYGYAVAKAKVETDLLLAAEKDKKAITPELTAQISAQAESYAQAVVEQNKLTEATKKATEAVNFVKNTTAGFINDLRDGLKNGESFWESFSNAALNVLDRITDKLLNDVMDAIFKVSNAGSSSGGGGFLSGLFGGLFGGTQWGGIKSGKITGGLFADGGYTGNASAKAVAGVVHGGEYVFSKKATDRIGLGNLEAMHRGAKGYAVGGYVGAASTSMPANSNVQAGGQSVIMVQLSPDLEAKILQQAASQTVKIVGQNEKNKQNLQQNGQAQNG